MMPETHTVVSDMFKNFNIIGLTNQKKYFDKYPREITEYRMFCFCLSYIVTWVLLILCEYLLLTRLWELRGKKEFPIQYFTNLWRQMMAPSILFSMEGVKYALIGLSS